MLEKGLESIFEEEPGLKRPAVRSVTVSCPTGVGELKGSRIEVIASRRALDVGFEVNHKARFPFNCSS